MLTIITETVENKTLDEGELLHIIFCGNVPVFDFAIF